MSSKIKACGISEDTETLTQLYVRKGENSGEITDEANTILESLKNVLLQNYQRKTIEGELGLWYSVKKNRVAYFALTDTAYSERLAYKLLQELEDNYNEFLNTPDLGKLKSSGNGLIEKYNNPANFDKLSQAQREVNDVKNNVQENINKMITNTDNLEDLEDQTKNMRDNANKFQKQSKTLEREMYWRKIKYTAMIVAIVIIVIVIIVVLVKVL